MNLSQSAMAIISWTSEECLLLEWQAEPQSIWEQPAKITSQPSSFCRRISFGCFAGTKRGVKPSVIYYTVVKFRLFTPI